MRYCNQCKKLTAGRPPFCNFCGRSYNVKLCPRGHQNPRAASACSTCGSKELSTPAPQAGMSTIGMVIGIVLLVALSIFAVYFAVALVSAADSGVFTQALVRLMDLGAELAVAFFFYMLVFGRKKKK